LTNLKGYTAQSLQSYDFKKDFTTNPIFLCFDGDGGIVSGDDTVFKKLGKSTLAGWVQNEGLELFEVYQIDRANRKILFTKSRIGSVGVLPGISDVVGSFVGDATKISDR
jgi:hypothetical protein